MSRYLFSAEALKEFTKAYFIQIGVPEQDAQISADVLIQADLRGVDSHGVIRLSTYYGSRIRRGLINPNPNIQVESRSAGAVRINGDAGLGQVVAHQAMLMCMEMASQAGSAIAVVHNSNHYGIAAYYAMMALSEDMIGISYTNSQALVAPTYGRTAVMGTNPMAYAIPTREGYPFVLDMATSIVPIGRITVYEKAGRQIPEGWGIDSSGLVTVDPKQVLNGGALMPLGGPDITRGYKGFGLAMVVDALSGVLPGAAFITRVGHPGENHPADVGHFFQAIRIDALRPLAEFKESMGEFLTEIRNAPKAEGQKRIFIPGEKEFELELKYREIGIPLYPAVVEMLKNSASEAGMQFELEPIGELED